MRFCRTWDTRARSASTGSTAAPRGQAISTDLRRASGAQADTAASTTSSMRHWEKSGRLGRPKSSRSRMSVVSRVISPRRTER